MSKLNIAQLKNMRESEDHVEFKKGEGVISPTMVLTKIILKSVGNVY